MYFCLQTSLALKDECGKPASQYKLEKAISSKFIRIKISSYVGDGPGIQYVGIETGKGIDLGIRGNIGCDVLVNIWSIYFLESYSIITTIIQVSQMQSELIIRKRKAMLSLETWSQRRTIQD